MFFTFPVNARWNDEQQTVRVRGRDRRVPWCGEGLAARAPNAYCRSGLLLSAASRRTISSGRFQSIAERKLRRRQTTEDGDAEISGHDLRKASAGNCASVSNLDPSGHSDRRFSTVNWFTQGYVSVLTCAWPATDRVDGLSREGDLRTFPTYTGNIHHGGGKANAFARAQNRCHQLGTVAHCSRIGIWTK